MKNGVTIGVVLAVLLLTMGAARGDVFGGVEVEAWAESSSGASDHEIPVVMDFGGGNQYVFGYRWNDGDTVTRPVRVSSDFDYDDYVDYTVTYGFGTQAQANTSEGAMIALNSIAGMVMTTEYDDFFGLSVINILYGSDEMGGNVTGQTWPALWLCGRDAYTDWQGTPHPASSPHNHTWEPAPIGMADRELHDAYWDGWTQCAAVGWDTIAPDITPTPEPATMLLLGGMAAPFVLKRRRRK
ncbi:MAG: PEP-CTERM sorting domain-containing protein [Phycisphaerae bacterium]|nr:PEP-CTERM sorting domain-containing protein [Phycisphaerae bacterium]